MALLILKYLVRGFEDEEQLTGTCKYLFIQDPNEIYLDYSEWTFLRTKDQFLIVERKICKTIGAFPVIAILLNATAYRKLIHNMQPSLLLRIIILYSLANQIKTWHLPLTGLSLVSIGTTKFSFHEPLVFYFPLFLNSFYPLYF